MKPKLIGRLARSVVIALVATAPSMAAAATPETAGMTANRLDRIFHRYANDVRRVRNVWRFDLDGVPMACIVDPPHDRMRIIAPVTLVRNLSPGQEQAMLTADFSSALDARYAISAGVVYAAFIHPLSPLQKREVVSALRQVVQAVQTFGSSYSSTDLVFGAHPSE